MTLPLVVVELAELLDPQPALPDQTLYFRPLHQMVVVEERKTVLVYLLELGVQVEVPMEQIIHRVV